MAFQLREAFGPKNLILIEITESTAIVGAAPGELDDQGMGQIVGHNVDGTVNGVE